MDAGDAASGPLSTLIVTDVSLLEGSDPAAPAEASVVVRLVPASDRTVTVDYATSDETAKAGSDYTAATGTLTFAPGVTTQTVKVTITPDRDVEPAETFAFVLSNPKDGQLGEPKATCTILDDDIPGVVVDDVTVVEGDTGLKNAAFQVKLTTAFKTPVTLNYSTVDGTALAGVDFIASSGTLTFLPGELAKTVLVPIKGDVLDEPDKAFFLTISNVIGAPVLDDRGKGTIQDDDPTPTLSIGDVSSPEGNAGSTSMTFTVKLSAPSGQDVSVLFATGGGTAKPTDYSGTSGTLTFAAGDTSKTINVTINGDLVDEADDTFNVTLSGAVNATITDAVGLGTIVNDDLPPVLTVADIALAEGMAGNTTFAFTLQLSGPSEKQLSVNYATADGSATAPGDYTSTSSLLMFPAGKTVATVNVNVIGDVADEGIETFALNLSNPVNLTLARTSAIATILNDDSVLPKVTIADVAVTEGNASGTVNAVFTVSLSVASSSPIAVDFATADGTATATSGDYVARTGMLAWAAFDGTPKTITVVVNGDALYETDETFFVNLSNPTAASITDAQGVGTITNDDAQPKVSIAPASGAEGNIGTKQLTLPVTLSGASSETITVDYQTSDGTATTGGFDYSQTSGTLTFAPGETSKSASVSLTGDVVYEGDETFTVTLSNAVNATILAGAASATGTIVNDDPVPTLSIADVLAAEGNVGTTDFTFAVTLSGPSGSNVTVSYATVDGTATSGSDYIAASGSLTFTPGQTSKTITVTVNGDYLNEPNETFSGPPLGRDGRGHLRCGRPGNDPERRLSAAYAVDQRRHAVRGQQRGRRHELRFHGEPVRSQPADRDGCLPDCGRDGGGGHGLRRRDEYADVQPRSDVENHHGPREARPAERVRRDVLREPVEPRERVHLRRSRHGDDRR